MYGFGLWLQVAEYFEAHAGPVAKINVQRDCRRLIALGHARHDARLAAERCLQRLLRACMQATEGAPANAGGVAAHGPAPPAKAGQAEGATAAGGGAAGWAVRVFAGLMPGLGLSEGRMRQELKRLKGLEARVEALTRDMEQETLRQRKIVSAFVTFKCAPFLRPPLQSSVARCEGACIVIVRSETLAMRGRQVT